MKFGKVIIAVVAAASLGLGVSAMAQGRPGGGPPAGRPGGGPGMAGPSMGSQMGGQMRGPGMAGQQGQMGQMNRQGTQRGRKSVQDLLTQNSKLSSNLQSILGTDANLQQASSGFKNLGLFVAAVHVSKNLNIPFDQLKSTMQSDGWNLGKAVHTLQPKLDKKQVKSAVKSAKKQAKTDMKHSR